MPELSFFQSVLPKATEVLKMSVSVQKASILSQCLKNKRPSSLVSTQDPNSLIAHSYNSIKKNNLPFPKYTQGLILPVPHLHLAKSHSASKDCSKYQLAHEEFAYPPKLCSSLSMFPHQRKGILIPNTQTCAKD